jgi:DNA-binding CsgD family transcriptional regulator
MMRNYAIAYSDALNSGLIKDEVVKGHIEQQMTIDRMLPDTASFFYVVEPNTRTYYFMGKQQASVSGYSNEEFHKKGIELFLKCLHPDERDIILQQIYPDFAAFVAKTPLKYKKDLLFNYNYRFKRKTGKYINLMEQIHILEVDQQGMAGLLLGNVIMIGGNDVLPMRATGKIFRKNQIAEILFSKVYTSPTNPINQITNRELDILRNLAAGKTSNEISKELFISTHTVDTHRRNLLKKLNCKSVVELARLAFKNGLL